MLCVAMMTRTEANQVFSSQKWVSNNFFEFEVLLTVYMCEGCILCSTGFLLPPVVDCRLEDSISLLLSKYMLCMLCINLNSSLVWIDSWVTWLRISVLFKEIHRFWGEKSIPAVRWIGTFFSIATDTDVVFDACIKNHVSHGCAALEMSQSKG